MKNLDKVRDKKGIEAIEKYENTNFNIFIVYVEAWNECSKLKDEEWRKIVEPLVRALSFYASSYHIQDLQDDLENPSGEPLNWVCDSDDKFNLENGGFARKALAEYEEKMKNE